MRFLYLVTALIASFPGHWNCQAQVFGKEPTAATSIARTPLNISVMILNEWGLQSAPRMVELAASHGHQRVNFVVTVHCQLDKNLNVQNYGLIRAQKGWKYQTFDDQLLAQFKGQLKAAFSRAAQLHLDIAILAHVDAAGPVFGWRNRFNLDPLKSCGGFSYKQVLIDGVAEALENSIGKTTHVEFALIGEMGKTVFAYPESYLQIMSGLRGRKRLTNLTTGVSLNFNELTGTFLPTESQRVSVQKLVEASDFLGFSCYGAVSVPPKAQDFTTMVADFVAGMKQQGILIPGDKKLHFSEIGLGGGAGSSKSGDTSIAREPIDAAKSPWSGTSDPRRNPWTSNAMRSFRQDYYRALLEFLRTQPGARKVASAYLWNAGSWCPFGFEHETFADEQIIRMIQEHNAQARR